MPLPDARKSREPRMSHRRWIGPDFTGAAAAVGRLIYGRHLYRARGSASRLPVRPFVDAHDIPHALQWRFGLMPDGVVLEGGPGKIEGGHGFYDMAYESK